MPDAPQVTISDPNDPREPGDVLAQGEEKSPYRPPRKAVVGAVVVALLAAGGYGVAQARERRAAQAREERLAARAFAESDRVDVQTTGVTVGADDPGSGRVRASVEVATQGLALFVTDLSLTGTDLGAAAGGYNGLLAETNALSVASPVECSDAAVGTFPRDWALRLEITPASHRAHEIALPLPPGEIRAAMLAACDLPDPDAVAEVTVEEQRGQLVVGVTPVPRSDTGLEVLSVSSPGFSLSRRLVAGEPRLIGPDFGALFPVDVRVTDCATARTGRVTVVLREGSRTFTVEAVDSPRSSYRRPGSPFLLALAARACP